MDNRTKFRGALRPTLKCHFTYLLLLSLGGLTLLGLLLVLLLARDLSVPSLGLLLCLLSLSLLLLLLVGKSLGFLGFRLHPNDNRHSGQRGL